MKLYLSPTSPYARKVRIVMIEKALEDRVEEVVLNPLDSDAAERIPHPLCLVPTLERDDGPALADSPLICVYLDSLSAQNRLIPEGDAQWQVLHLQSLGDGMMDKAFSTVMERKRTDAEQSVFWQDRWLTGIDRTLDAVEELWTEEDPPFDLGAITIISLLTYLDLRLAERPWRPGHPKLSAWLERMASRESVKRTAYPS